MRDALGQASRMKRVLVGLSALVGVFVFCVAARAAAPVGSLGIKLGDRAQSVRERFGDPVLRAAVDGGADVRYVLPALNLELDVEERSGYVAAYELGPWRASNVREAPSVRYRLGVYANTPVVGMVSAPVADSYGVTMGDSKTDLMNRMGRGAIVADPHYRGAVTVTFRVGDGDAVYHVGPIGGVFALSARLDDARRAALSNNPVAVVDHDGGSVDQAVRVMQPGRMEASVAEQAWAATNLCDGSGVVRRDSAISTAGARTIERVTYGCRGGEGLTPSAFFDLTGIDLSQ